MYTLPASDQKSKIFQPDKIGISSTKSDALNSVEIQMSVSAWFG